MKNKFLSRARVVFYSLIIIFVLLVLYFAIPFAHEIKRALFPAVAVLGFLFFLLGGALVYFTFKSKVKGKLKVFLLLTGFYAVGVLVCVLLHNFVYGLMIYLFGEGIWGEGGDEALFFILALIVCPIVFLVGMIGSLVVLRRGKK
ncbi:MAG: hypothetical protein ABIH92_04080 [Nanoarchaeota archaeon]